MSTLNKIILFRVAKGKIGDLPNFDLFTGADPGFFLGGDAPLRNNVTDW